MRAPHWRHAHHSNGLLFSTLAATPVVMSDDTPVVQSREATGPGRAEIPLEGSRTKSEGVWTRCHAQKKDLRSRMTSKVYIRKWQLPTLPPGGAVPSAMASLTSLFGMGRGGSSPL